MYKLFCYTSSGYECYKNAYNSEKEAKAAGREIKRLGFAFSYNVTKG